MWKLKRNCLRDWWEAGKAQNTRYYNIPPPQLENIVDESNIDRNWVLCMLCCDLKLNLNLMLRNIIIYSRINIRLLYFIYTTKTRTGIVYLFVHSFIDESFCSLSVNKTQNRVYSRLGDSILLFFTFPLHWYWLLAIALYETLELYVASLQLYNF